MNDSTDDMNLQDLWQKTPPVDVSRLMRSVEQAQKRMRRFFYYEIGSGAIGLLLLIWLAFKGLLSHQAPFFLVVVVSAIAAQYWTWTWRRDLWGAFAESPAQMLQLKRRHLLLDLKIARSCSWGVLAGLIVGAAVAYFDKSESVIDISDEARILILTGAALFMVGVMIWGVLKEISTHKKIKLLDENIREFEEHENL